MADACPHPDDNRQPESGDAWQCDLCGEACDPPAPLAVPEEVLVDARDAVRDPDVAPTPEALNRLCDALVCMSRDGYYLSGDTGARMAEDPSFPVNEKLRDYNRQRWALVRECLGAAFEEHQTDPDDGEGRHTRRAPETDPERLTRDTAVQLVGYAFHATDPAERERCASAVVALVDAVCGAAGVDPGAPILPALRERLAVPSEAQISAWVVEARYLWEEQVALSYPQHAWSLAVRRVLTLAGRLPATEPR